MPKVQCEPKGQTEKLQNSTCNFIYTFWVANVVRHESIDGTCIYPEFRKKNLMLQLKTSHVDGRGKGKRIQKVV